MAERRDAGGQRRDPGVLSRMRAALQGERNAATLDAMRSAGTSVYEELSIVETRRDERRLAGHSPWDAPPDVASHALTTWNAYVLQTLGETLLDTAANGESGFVPPDTFDLAWRWFGQVQPWLSRARQARSNPGYDIRAELNPPVDLAPWAPHQVLDNHLAAMLEADVRLRERAEYAVFALESGKHPPYADDSVNRLRQLTAIAGSAADYARALRQAGHEPTTNRMATVNLRQALSTWYQIGQLAAFPALLRRFRLPRARPRFDPERLPGGDSFNPWCLTDEATVEAWQADPTAVRSLDALWEADPDPAATLQIKAEIDMAVEEGAVVRVFLPGRITCYHRCPWSSLYEVRRSVTLAGRRFGALQQFTLDVSAEAMYWGRPFVRRLVLGPFRANEPVRSSPYPQPPSLGP
ncbi:MAG: hypothetical protein WCA46_28045, partial [Actinocatenispora sp.]